MTPEDVDLIEQAAALLDSEALALRLSHTVGGDGDWAGEEAAKAAHDEFKNTSVKLYDLAERIQKEKAK
jgi:hypothetical protein